MRAAFVLVAALDLALMIAWRTPSRSPLGVRAEAFAYVTFQTIGWGLLIGAGVDLWSRLRVPRLAAPLATWAVGIAVGVIAFAEDFSVFAPAMRAVLLVLAPLPLVALALAHRAMARGGTAGASVGTALGAVALGLGGIGCAVQNHLVLDGTYPGIHFAGTTFAGAVLGVALQHLGGAWAHRDDAPEGGSAAQTSGRASRAALAGLTAAAALASATSFVTLPRNAARTEIARIPIASMATLLADLHGATGSAGRAAIPPEQVVWFSPRDASLAVPPSPRRGPAPVVIVVTVDSLRADVVEKAREGRAFRRLAARGASFRNARSPSSSTFPTVATMLTGRYFSSLRWTEEPYRDKRKHFLREEPSVQFPELLTSAGVRAVQVPTVEAFLPEYPLVRGLAPISEVFRASSAPAIDRAIRFLDEVGDEPAFLWTHLMDTHYPYGEGPGHTKKKYLRQVKRMGALVEKLAKAIEKSPARSRTYLVVAADHGEAFREHGTRHHATTVYDELVHVPLIVLGPQVAPRVIDVPVGLVDLGPTVLDLFGQSTPGTFLGQSLVPLLRGRCLDGACLTRPVAIDSGRRKQAMIFPDGWKAIRNLGQLSSELYFLPDDPGETRNLVDEEPREATLRLARLAAFFDGHEHRSPGYRVPSRE
jgi:arylsulfatase A-like enzyme